MQSWKRDNCGGKTPAMATEALQKHLVRSHKMSDEHATEVLCELCDEDMKICMMDCDDEEIDETQVDEKNQAMQILVFRRVPFHQGLLVDIMETDHMRWQESCIGEAGIDSSPGGIFKSRVE